MKHGLESLRLEPGSTILVPDYVCDVVLDPVAQLGLAHRYYPLGDDLAPDWDELEARVTSATRALLAVHYFGQPQDLVRFREFCDRHGLRLLEDNAHGHGGELDGRPLGSFGDVGISSPRKFLGTPQGGALWLDGEEVYLADDVAPSRIPWPKTLQRYVSKRFPGLNRRVKSIVRGRPSYDDPRADREGPVPDGSLDPSSARVFADTDWRAMRARRQEVYGAWREFAQRHDLSPVYGRLHPEANPWCFPAYAASAEVASRWCAWGAAGAVRVFRWPALPEEIVVEGGACLDRWHRLLCFSTEDSPPEEPI